MSDYTCSKCGRDCGSKMALGKHEGSCINFTHRFNDNNRCPKCSNQHKSFYKLDKDTLVCMECGLHFMPLDRMVELRNELKEVKWRR